MHQALHAKCPTGYLLTTVQGFECLHYRACYMSLAKFCGMLVEAMKRRHNLTPSEIVQRYQFNSHFHKGVNSVAQYIAALQT